MESLKSIQHKGHTINFSFHNGALAFMRDMGYVIDYNKNPLEGLEASMDIFLTDFLLCAAKFYSRKEPNFEYDRFDAYDWMDIIGGFEPVIKLFTDALSGKMIIPEGAIIPNETPKKLNLGDLKK